MQQITQCIPSSAEEKHSTVNKKSKIISYIGLSCIFLKIVSVASGYA